MLSNSLNSTFILLIVDDFRGCASSGGVHHVAIYLKGPSRNSQLITMHLPVLSSSPSTPSSETPIDRSCWRFNSIYEQTEWVEAYSPTGYHPVHFGDLLHDGQYKSFANSATGHSRPCGWSEIHGMLHLCLY